jgi:hypothetical protein
VPEPRRGRPRRVRAKDHELQDEAEPDDENRGARAKQADLPDVEEEAVPGPKPGRRKRGKANIPEPQSDTEEDDDDEPLDRRSRSNPRKAE